MVLSRTGSILDYTLNLDYWISVVLEEVRTKYYLIYIFRSKKPCIESGASEDVDVSDHNSLNKATNIAENIDTKTIPCTHRPSNDIGLYISAKEICWTSDFLCWLE